MWVYTGNSLVNITGAQQITAERESSDDRRTVFIVAASFGEAARVSLAEIELVFPESLIVALGADAEDLALSPRERAERRARAECDACLRALADALGAGKVFCDLSGSYTPIIQV